MNDIKKGCLFKFVIAFVSAIVVMSILIAVNVKMEKNNSKQVNSTNKLLEQISIEGRVMKIANKKTITSYTIKNNSSKLYSGEIQVILNDKERTKDIAVLEIKDLAPNTSVIKNVESGVLENPKFSFKVEGKFSDVSYYTSKYYHEIIFEKDGGVLKQLYVLVNKIDKAELEDIVKEYKEKYKGKLSTINFFDKSQNVKIGENPYSNNIDEKAQYTIGDDKLIINNK